MPGYVVTGPNATGTANKSLITIIAAATVRPAVFDVLIGNAQTPADQSANVALQRFTAVGTAGSSPTPEPLDAGERAALATAGITHSAEPTYTANKKGLNISLNQRATFRWVASPGYEFKAPATANNGVGLVMVSATAAMILDGTLMFTE
jgi:hypothetical protein